MPCSNNCSNVSRAERRRAAPARSGRGALTALLLTLALCGASGRAHADAQRDPELRGVVAQAIASAECFPDKFDSAVWYTLMEPKLRRTVRDTDERMQILKTAFCEAHRPGEQRLPPGLIMAVMDVESRFNRWAVSSAGAVGLMQVMPFWPGQLGMKRHQLTQIEANMRMGCAILRFYLQREKNDVRRALARYNGSVGRREYPDKVVLRWTNGWNGADDLGLAARH
ncbi:MAG TPA: lytic transglycosylase domain-containing protein [Steroidobacteraceae bacterium]|nr:lytic transglycosylase domain-containing protein [Steroidobacteraceae bacterium]